MRRVVATLALATVVAVAAAAASAPANGARNSKWYWTPAACKYELQSSGVRFGDGRTFSAAKAFCVGFHNHCWLDRGVRRYKVFVAVARSYDGVVRVWQLTVTGKHTWSGSHMKVVEQHMTASEFNRKYGPTAWTIAAQENQGGCYDIHP